jgi:cytochrome c biogenesis protein CcmG/thiol:disulfide interchange protein DsbE
MNGTDWMPNHNSFNKAGKIVTIIVTFAFLISACSGGNISQEKTAQLGGQLQAKQSLPGQEPAKLAQPDVQPAELPAGETQTMPLAEEQPAPVEPAAAAPVDALAAPAEPPAALAEAAPKAAPAVDLSIPVEPKIGFRAPDFTLQTLNGETVRLSELVGRPVVISYWATWCIPCQKELPILEQLFREYQPQGLVVMTVNAIEQDTQDAVQTMVGENGMTLPVLLDQGNQFASTYGALFFPTTIFVDASGVIRFIRLGDSSETELRTKVENLMAGTL